MKAYYFNHNGKQTIDIQDINEEDTSYFQNNNIKVSLEEIRGDIVAYGCPYEDSSEESEVIVFANGRGCKEVMAELVLECKKAFG